MKGWIRMNKNISIGKMTRYAILFLALVFFASFLVMRSADMQSVWEAVKETSFRWLGAGLLMACVFPLAEGINIRLLLRSFAYPVTFAQGMKYAYLGYFFSSITPSSTGGQPVQLYSMNKDGISVTHGALALLAELTSFQAAVFLMEAGAVSLMITGRISLKGPVLILACLGFLINILFISLLSAVIFSERLGQKLRTSLHVLIRRIPVKDRQKWDDLVDSAFEDFESCAKMIRKNPRLMGKMFCVSVVQVACWFSIPWAVFRAMGETGVSYPELFVLQTILYMASALLPFPGAEGISQYVFARLFAGVFVDHPMAAAILVNRGVSFYFLLVLSGLMGFSFYICGRNQKMKSKKKEKVLALL